MCVKKYITRNILFFVLAVASICFSKPATAQGQFTNMGKDFLVAFASNNSRGVSQLDLEVKIVASKETNVRMTFLYDNTVVEFTIPANTIRSYLFTDAEMTKIYSTATGPDKRGLRIETDNNVTIYALNLSVNTTDATAVLPINNYGKEYINIGVPSSGCMIIATEDNTTVSIEGVVSSITLQKHQVYRNLSASVGKKITADKDIAVFNVHSCSNWPNGACDHQWEQLIPTANYGKEFFVPRIGCTAEAINIVATQANTVLTIKVGTAAPYSYTLQPGSAYILHSTATLSTETTKSFSADTYISADKQIGVTAHIGGTYLTYQGDPATAWVPPIEQNINSAYIAAFETSKSAIRTHFILIVAKTTDKGDTKINGVATTGWRDHSSGYSSLTYMMADKTIPYEIINPKGVVVTAFGVGSYESYFYLAASSARKLDASFYITNDGNRYHYQDPDVSTPFDCGSPFTFEAEIQYELHNSPGRLKWYIDGSVVSSAQDQLTWTQPYLSAGDHQIKLVIKDINGEEEILETTLNVKCATGIDPAVKTILEGQTLPVKITLSGSAPTNIVFNLSAYTGTTASPTDYSFPATATIPMGASEIIFNVIAETDDIINEPDEILKLRAYNSEYGELFSTITIKDVVTTAQKTLTISVDPAMIYEPHTGITSSPIQTTVKLSLPTGVTTHAGTAIPVSLAYTGSTATLNADYSLTPATASSSVTIPGGGTSVSFVVKALEDNLYEEDELVKIAATPPAGYTMGTGNVSITIKDQTPGGIVVAKLLDAEELPTPVVGKFRIRFDRTDVRTKKKIEILYKLTGVANDGTVYDLINPTSAIIPVDSYYIDVEIKPKNNYIVEGTREVTIELLSVSSIP